VRTGRLSVAVMWTSEGSSEHRQREGVRRGVQSFTARRCACVHAAQSLAALGSRLEHKHRVGEVCGGN